MAKVSDPTYVSGRAPNLKIQPPIEHPAFCVCPRCSKLPAEERTRPHVFRIYRASKFPASERDSIIHAADVKSDEERKLREAAEAALSAEGKAPVGPDFKAICGAYTHHQERDGKRIDRNQYVITALLNYFGETANPAAISKADFAQYVETLRTEKLAPETIGRRTRIMLAILNSAVRDGLIPSHQLRGVRRPIVKRTRKPVTFTPRQLDILRGSAMDLWEREQLAAIEAFDPRSHMHPPTMIPLRGLCMVAYRTLMRPGNNFGLEWRQLVIDEKHLSGRFRLDEHKNVSRGVEVEGPLHRELVAYLIERRRTEGGSRYVHANPSTGRPYVNIRSSWLRLCEIANDILHKEHSEDLRDEQLHFYTWRHTGASRLAESGADPVMVVRMMGDVDLETVIDHYFDSSIEHMQKMIEKWD